VSEAASAVDAVEVGKSYGGVAALTAASFAATAGEVHALVGENGAGKSTLIKILGGRVRPDTGTVRIRGQAVSLSGPQAAHDLGAWTVFQELTLLPWMTVAENLLLLREPKGGSGLISRSATIRDADALLARFGVMHIDPRALVEDISLAERQTVEIVRAVSNDPQILFLDEPTSSLVEREVEWLFGQIRALRARGACVVFTSHRWAEIRSIADRITIFRGGKDVGTFTDIDEDKAVRLMTGRRVEALYPERPPLPRSTPRSSWGRTSAASPSASARARCWASAALRATAIASCSACCSAMPGRAAASWWFTAARDTSAHRRPRSPRAWRWCPRTARPRACCCG
jgi:ribose transport system ATP-binding protein